MSCLRDDVVRTLKEHRDPYVFLQPGCFDFDYLGNLDVNEGSAWTFC